MTRPRVTVREAPVITRPAPVLTPPSPLRDSPLRPSPLRESALRPSPLRASALREGPSSPLRARSPLQAPVLPNPLRRKGGQPSRRMQYRRSTLVLPSAQPGPGRNRNRGKRRERYVLDLCEWLQAMGMWEAAGRIFMPNYLLDFDDAARMRAEDGDGPGCDELRDGFCLMMDSEDQHMHPMGASLSDDPAPIDVCYEWMTRAEDYVSEKDLKEPWQRFCEDFDGARMHVLNRLDEVFDDVLIGGPIAVSSLRLAGYDPPSNDLGMVSARDAAHLCDLHMQSDAALCDAVLDTAVIQFGPALAEWLEEERIALAFARYNDLCEELDCYPITGEDAQVLAMDPDQFPVQGGKDLVQLTGDWLCVEARYQSLFAEDADQLRQDYPFVIGWRECEMVRHSGMPNA